MLIIAGYISKEKENHNNNQTKLKQKGSKYFSLHEMNILFMKVSLFYLNFERKKSIHIFEDAPVCKQVNVLLLMINMVFKFITDTVWYLFIYFKLVILAETMC